MVLQLDALIVLGLPSGLTDSPHGVLRGRVPQEQS